MATQTTNYDLVKPAGTDAVDIGDINGNMDIIDGVLKDHEDVLDTVVAVSREFSPSETSVTVAMSANKAILISAAGTNGGTGEILDSTNGCLIYVANGKYAVLHKGSGITITTSSGNITVTSSSAVDFSVVEL